MIQIILSSAALPDTLHCLAFTRYTYSSGRPRQRQSVPSRLTPDSPHCALLHTRQRWVLILGIMPPILPSLTFHPQPKLLIPSLFLGGSIAYVWGKPASSTRLIIGVFALSIKFPIVFSKSFIFVPFIVFGSTAVGLVNLFWHRILLGVYSW